MRTPSATKLKNLISKKAPLAAWYAAFPDDDKKTVRNWFNGSKARLASAQKYACFDRAVAECVRKLKDGRRDLEVVRRKDLWGYKKRLLKRDTQHRRRRVSVQEVADKINRSLRTYKLEKPVSRDAVELRIKALKLDLLAVPRGDPIDNEPMTGQQHVSYQHCRNFQGW